MIARTRGLLLQRKVQTMPNKQNWVLTVAMLLGFAVLAAVFSWLSGMQVEVLGILLLGAGISVFVLWAAGARSPGR